MKNYFVKILINDLNYHKNNRGLKKNDVLIYL